MTNWYFTTPSSPDSFEISRHDACDISAAMRRGTITPVIPMLTFGVLITSISALPLTISPGSGSAPAPPVSVVQPAVITRPSAVLEDSLVVAWYGNPWNGKMGILGRLQGPALAQGLKQQANAYTKVTKKNVVAAYELIAVVAQAQPGTDGMYRRRETRAVIERTIREARAAGFKTILDVQTGRSTVLNELAYIAPYLAEPDVYLALDPEFSMGTDGVPGRRIGTMFASEVNDAIGVLETIIERHHLPPKLLIVHQFTTGMLPDKDAIWTSPVLDIVLDMDGFGSPALKRHTYKTVLRQKELEYTGFKLFYIQDTDMLEPAQVLALDPPPAVVIYQ
jgi:hypothetical protein